MEETMRHSETLEKIAPALVKAQQEIEPAPKGAENPYFNSRYTTLTELWSTVREVLGKNGLSVVQVFEPSENGTILLGTTLLHESGEWIGGVLAVPVKKADPQAVGSAITYGRRYALAALLGVVSDEDDDGNAASKPQDDSYTPFDDAEPPPRAGTTAKPLAAPDKQFGSWTGRLTAVDRVDGESNGKPWTRYDLKGDGCPNISAWHTTEADKAQTLVGEAVVVGWKKKGKYYDLIDIFPAEGA